MGRYFSFLFIILFICCKEPKINEKLDPFIGMSKSEKDKALEFAWKASSKKEEIQIKGYLERHQIPAVSTKTGVHYYIYQTGEGANIEDGQSVLVDYVVTKINGDTLYTTQKKLDEFRVSNSEKESGLHEAMKLLRPGARAIVILPSHRAHGISGDTDKIPPLTTVIYNLTVKRVN